MSEFDEFCASLLEEAKRFYEKAREVRSQEAEVAYLHSSILLGISSLEAYINGIAAELMIWNDIPLNEKALLAEREIELKKGKYILTQRLKIFRLVDRIEYLYRKFNGEILKTEAETWYPKLTNSIDLRNKLVHPKENMKISTEQVEILLTSVIDCLVCISKVVYNKEFPFKNLGLQSKMTF